MRALILNCTLKSSPGESNTDALSDVVAAALEERGSRSTVGGWLIWTSRPECRPTSGTAMSGQGCTRP